MDLKKSVVVWGTGAVLKQKYHLLEEFHILYFIDKDKDKQNTMIHGIEIKAPQNLRHEDCSYIILMTDHYMEIMDHIEDSDIPKEKMIPYIYIGNISQYKIKTKNGAMYLSDWIKDNDRKILLISHEFSRTGAPIALLNLAVELRKIGYSILMTGMGSSALLKEIEERGIDYIEDSSLYYQCDQFLKSLSEFELIVVNTIALQDVVLKIAKSEVDILWWIHESTEEYYKNLQINHYKNVHIFGVGNRVIQYFNKCCPEIEIGKLLYSLPDFSKKTKIKNGKLVIAVIGLIQYRKGIDILVEALNGLKPKDLAEVQLLIVGKLEDWACTYWKNAMEKAPEGLEYFMLGELDYSQMKSIYQRIDLLICPSREDPMPITVTEAMMNRVACVVSENVGQKEFIMQGINGFVFSSIDELTDLISWAVCNKRELELIGSRSREIYDANFSSDRMHTNLLRIISQFAGKEGNNE